jgi:hypothetical protein
MQTLRTERAAASAPDDHARASTAPEDLAPLEARNQVHTTPQDQRFASNKLRSLSDRASLSSFFPQRMAHALRPAAARIAAGYNISIDWYENLGRRAPLRFAMLTVVMLLGLVFSIFEPGFDTNDDAVMNMIVAGKGYGLVPDEHIVFSNVSLGFMLKHLYLAMPWMPWYGGYLLLVHFLANVTVLYCAVRPGYTRLRLRLFLLYFATAGLYLINNLQFTSSAFLAGQSGLLLMLLAVRMGPVEQGLPVWRLFALAFVFLVTASLIRREVFYAVVGLAIPTCGLLALVGARPLRRALACAGVVAAALAVGTVCWRFNDDYYNGDPGWRNFYAYNKLRVKFNDEAWVYYAPETAHVFDEVNWSENDFAMLSAWFFDDNELYSLEALRQVLEGYPWKEARISGEMVGQAVGVLRDRESLALLLALPLLLYCLERRAAFYATVAIALATAGGMIGYLILFQKTPPSRVYVPTLAFPLAVAVCLAHGGTFFPPPRMATWLRINFLQPRAGRRVLRLPISRYVTATLLVLVCVAVYKGVYPQYRRSRERVRSSQELYDLLASANVPGDKLYVCWAASFPFEALCPFDSLQSLENVHLLVVGWPQKTPLHQRVKDHFGIDDLTQAIYRRNDLFLIAHPYYLGLYEQYVREHFGAEIQYETRRYSKLFVVSQAIERQAHSDAQQLATPLSSETRKN